MYMYNELAVSQAQKNDGKKERSFLCSYLQKCKSMSLAWDYVDPVDILSKLPKNFQELVASKKWQERKEALEFLQTLATENIRLDATTNYKEIVQTLSKILAKDSNINVCAAAAKCIAQLAKGLGTNFASYLSSVASVIFEKFKEKKAALRDPLIEAIDAVYSTTNVDVMTQDIAAAIVKQNPNIKIQTNLFLYRIFKSSSGENAPSKKAIKTLTPLIVKCTGESDAEVREAAYLTLGAIMNAIGKSNAMTMLSEISSDKTKIEQIEKFYAQVQAEVAEQKKQQHEEIDGGQGEGVSAEDFVKLQNINTKLIAEKGEMKTKIDKVLVDYKKVSQELSKALQKITQMETEKKEMQTSNTTLQQELTTTTKKCETLERQLASRLRSTAAAPPTTNGISRPATTSIQTCSNSGLSSTTSKCVTTTITAKPISSRFLAPMASSASSSRVCPPVAFASSTGLRLPSRSGSQTSIPISDAVQKALASGSRLPAAPR